MNNCKKCKNKIPDKEELCFYCKRKESKKPKNDVKECMDDLNNSTDLFDLLGKVKKYAK